MSTRFLTTSSINWHLIKTAHKDGKTVSICGQAPSEYPEFTNFLIQSGIDYVSVNPDMVKETKRNVAHLIS
ncbi:hypothetical protein WP50_11965 [Lactiplantibacillus plantarum]|nr:hypothetical protein WP50_11965 [Lactiplantibacillus plantarum]